MRSSLLLAIAASSSALYTGAVVAANKPALVGRRAGSVVLTTSLNKDDEPGFVGVISDLSITALRIGTCALMVHHGFDKIQNVDGFSANVVAILFPDGKLGHPFLLFACSLEWPELHLILYPAIQLDSTQLFACSLHKLRE